MFTATEADNTWGCRKPWNRGKVTGPKPPLQASTSGLFGHGCNWPTELGI